MREHSSTRVFNKQDQETESSSPVNRFWQQNFTTLEGSRQVNLSSTLQHVTIFHNQFCWGSFMRVPLAGGARDVSNRLRVSPLFKTDPRIFFSLSAQGQRQNWALSIFQRSILSRVAQTHHREERTIGKVHVWRETRELLKLLFRICLRCLGSGGSWRGRGRKVAASERFSI